MSRFAKMEVLVYNDDQKALIDAGIDVSESYESCQKEVRLINIDQIVDIGPDAKDPDYTVIDTSNGDSFIVPMHINEFEWEFISVPKSKE